ncbi:response regulator [Chitinophaga horti]|uniref:Response regulator n=1 Tax=Chitinophaga horti TaxID=2920382 RepID=A0ABY6IVQ7_9BACT|nr:response regulator [Chitinophaga horti]UYQ91455.1 response regulator [Chitinophaga horti]
MLPTILIVDDNKEILEFVEEILGDQYHILKITNGQQALELLSSTTVQLIVSDVMMPVMDGFEFCRRIKSDLEHCHIPVILLTAKNTLVARIEGLELGADAYIEKPFSPRHLKAQVANLLANRGMLREYFVNTPLIHIKSMASGKADEQFLERLNDIILQHLDNAQLDGELLAVELNMSRPTLYRKIKAISNLTVHELINLARLKKAAALLAEGNLRVFEVAHITGFSSPNHFNRIFAKQFSMSPTAFMKTHAGKRDHQD